MKTNYQSILRSALPQFPLSAFCLSALGLLLLAHAPGTQAATQYAAGTLNWANSGGSSLWGSIAGGPYTAAWTSGNDAVFEGTAGTVTLSGAATAHNINFNTTSYILSGAQTLTLNGTTPTISPANGVAATIGNNTATVLDGSAGLTKLGGGTLTLNGSAVNQFTAGLSLNAGTLALDFAYLGTPTDLINSGNALSLGGGRMTVTGKNSGTTSQTFASTTANAGGGSILVNPFGGTSTTMVLNGLTTSAAGGSLLLGTAASPGAGTVAFTTTTAKDAQNIYGGRVVFTSDGGTTVNWATTASGSSPYTLSAYSGYTAMVAGTTSDTLNDRVTASLTLSGAHTHNSLKIENPAASQTLALGANLLTLTSGGMIFTGGNNYTISGTTGATRLTAGAGSSYDLVLHNYCTFATAGTTISAVIGDNVVGGTHATSLTLAGPVQNQLTLSGVNTFTGPTYINGGRMQIGAANILGNTSGIYIANGGQLNLSAGFNFVKNIQISGFGRLDGGAGGVWTQFGALRISTSTDLQGTITLASDARIGKHNGNLGTVSGKITGGYAIDFQGSSQANSIATTIALSNTGNDYTGDTSISHVDYNVTAPYTGGSMTLKLGASGVLPDGAGKGNLVFNGADADHKTILDLAGFSETVNGLSATGAAGAQILNSSATASTLTVGAGNTTSTFSGLIGGTGANNNNLALSKTGTGTLKLTGANTYTGATTISGGTVIAANVASFGTSSQINFGGGTLQLATDSSVNAYNLSVGSSATGNLILDRATAGAAFTETLGTLFMGAASGSIMNVTAGASVTSGTPVASFSVINMSGGSGAGTSTINPTTARVVVVGGASTSTTSAKTLALSGSSTGNSIGGNITDGSNPVSLTKANSSTWTLNGANNNYSGNTTISGGTLVLGSGATIPNTPTNSVAANATLDVTASGLTIGALQVLTGAGTVSGAVTSNGKITPGSSGIGTLTIGTLTLDGGSTLDFEFPVSGANDSVNVSTSGGLTLNGGAFNLYQTGTTTAFTQNGTYNLLQYAGTLNGNVANLSVANPQSGKTYLFSVDGTYVKVTIGDAPTPDYWGVDADGSWSTAGNWNPTTVPNVQFGAANFGGSGSPSFTGPHTVTLDGDNTIGALTFNTAQPFTINQGSSGSLLLDNGNGTALITDTLGSHTVNAPIALPAAGASVSLAASTSLSLNGIISGTSGIVESGSGTLTLGGVNSYSGLTAVNGGTLTLSGATTCAGGTTLSAGAQLNINNGGSSSANSALGTGALTIGGGTIDNTSSGDVTLLPSIAQFWNGDFTYAGSTHNLNLGSGNVTLSANRQVTVTANKLTVGGNIPGTYKLTKAGSGTLALAGANSYSGGTTISAGTLTLNGANSYGNGLTTVGSVSGNAVLNIGSGGSVTANDPNTTTPCFLVGTASGANGAVNLSGGGSLTVTGSAYEQNLCFGKVVGSYGYFGMTDSSTLNTVRLHLGGVSAGSGGGNGGTGVGLITGGTATVTDFLMLCRLGGQTGCLTIQGGTLNHMASGGGAATASVSLAYQGGRGELNLTGGNLNSTGTSLNIEQAGNTTGGSATGIVNLNSGTLTVNSIANSGGSAYLNFNGGTLKAGTGSTTFIPSTMTAVNVYSGGATIDSQAYNITSVAALLAPGNSGVTGISMTTGTGVNKGSGYIGAPYVSITGGTLASGGSPATAIANMAPDSTGNGTYQVDSITITCPGVYSDTTTVPLAVTFIGGGGSGAVAGEISTAANTSGGLTKLGTGGLTLSAASTYTGNTTISGGTLALGASGSIANSPTITVASDATFDISGVSGGFTLGTAQTLKGNGTVSGAIAVHGTIAAGASVGTLNTGSETWAPGGINIWEMADATGTKGGTGWDWLNITGDLTITATNKVAGVPADGNKFILKLVSLSGGAPGPAANFHNNVTNTWIIATVSGSVSQFNANKFLLDTSGFAHDLAGGTFSVVLIDQSVALAFTPASPGCTDTPIPTFSLGGLGTGNTNVMMTFVNSSGLSSVQALTANNCTITGVAYDASANSKSIGAVVKDLRTSLVGLGEPISGVVTKVVLTATKLVGHESEPAAVNAIVMDFCGRGKSFDPVITTLTIVSGNRVTQRFEGLISAERYLRVINATPGLKWLEINLNGRVFRLDPLAAGQDVAADLGSAMHEGDNNVVILTGGGDIGASAFVTITDAASDGLVALPEMVSLTLNHTTDGLVLGWPDTLTGWELQSSGSAGSGWAAVLTLPQVVGGQSTVTVPTTGGAQFYRLAGPAAASATATGLRESQTPLSVAKPQSSETIQRTYDGLLW